MCRAHALMQVSKDSIKVFDDNFLIRPPRDLKPVSLGLKKAYFQKNSDNNGYFFAILGREFLS